MAVTLRDVHVQYALSAPKVYHGTNLSVSEERVTVAHYPQLIFPFAQAKTMGSISPSGPRTE